MVTMHEYQAKMSGQGSLYCQASTPNLWIYHLGCMWRHRMQLLIDRIWDLLFKHS